ncbi:MAG: cytochrome c1 [Proteobacteria bacterium]|nr:cytochrome c1 [Pseudomonadota bacterium]
MTKRSSFFALALAALAALAPSLAFAGEGEGLLEANVHLTDRASLQRGAALFMNYCSGCHSLKYLRYGRMGDDLGLTEKQVTENLNFTGAKNLDHINVAMNPTDAENWFGKTPPDLSLEARSRGTNWIYTYLKSFYVDESRPSGWNNTLLPNAAMPNVLWQLQGSQDAVTEPKHGNEPCARGEVEGKCIKDLAIDPNRVGQMTPAEFDQAARDISAFLQYAGEPAAMEREEWGWKVVLFLAFFTFLAYLLKHEFWRDVH